MILQAQVTGILDDGLIVSDIRQNVGDVGFGERGKCEALLTEVVEGCAESKKTYFPTRLSRIDYSSVEREGDDLPRYELAGFLQRLLRGHFESAAAGDLHADDGHGFDVVLADDFRQFLRIVHGVKLGASDNRHLAAHELVVERGV